MIKNNKLRTVRRTNQYGLGSFIKNAWDSQYGGKNGSANLGKDSLDAGLGLISQFGNNLSNLAAQNLAKERQEQQEDYEAYKQSVAGFNNYQKQQMANQAEFRNTSQSLMANQQQQVAQEQARKQQGQLNILAPSTQNQYLAGGLISASIGAASSLLNGTGALIAGGRESGVGNALNTIPVVGGFLGGAANGLFGSKENKALHAQVNQDTNYLNTFQSDANSFDSVSGPRAVSFNTDVYSGGLFSKDSARRKNAKLQQKLLAAETKAYNGVDNNIDNLKTQQSNMLEASYAAFGGPLGHSYMYGFGGNVNTHGGDFPTGLTHINAGGTHEESPYQGVPMGQDAEGTPNLVEENETIYNDYVFSERLKVPVIDTPMNGKKYQQWEKVLRKYKNKSYSDAAKKAEEDSGVDERPNDPIARRGFESVLEILAQSQEQVRDIENNPDQAEQISSMSPEEYANYKAEQEQQQAEQQQAMQEQMQEQQAQQMSPEEQAMMQPQAMQQQQMSPEEQAMVQQQMMAQQGAQPQMAYGGNLHAEGGQLSPEEQAAMTQQEVPPTGEVPADQELSTPPGTEEAPQDELAEWDLGTPAEEMSTSELNSMVDKLYKYAKDNKDKDMLQRARKAKRGSRDDKEEFVDDSREDIQMVVEEQQQQQEAAQAEQATAEQAMQAEQQQAMQAAQADAGAELDAQDGGANGFALGGQMSLNNTQGGQDNEEAKLYAGTKVDTEKDKKEVKVKALDRQYKKRGIDPTKLTGKAKEQYEKDKAAYIANKDKKDYDIDKDKSLSINDYSKDDRQSNTQLFNALSNGATRTKSSGKGVAWNPIKGHDYIDGADANYWKDNTHYNNAGGLYDYKDNVPTEWHQKYNIDKYLADMKAGNFTPAQTTGNIPSRKDSRAAAKTIEKDPTYQAFWKDLIDNWDSDKARQIRKALADNTGKGYDDITKEYAQKQATIGNVGYFHTPVEALSNTPTGTRYRYTDNQGNSHWIRKPEGDFTEKSRTNSTVNGVNMTDIDVEPINVSRNLAKIGNTIVDVTNMENSPYVQKLTRAVADDDTSGLGNGVNPTTNWVGQTEDEDDPFPRIPLTGMIGGLGANIGATLLNALTPIDYSNADAIESATRNIVYKPVGFTPVGSKLTYRPMDRNSESNKLQAQMGAERRSIENLANGNRATAAANLFNSDSNLIAQLGDLDYKAELANRGHEAQVAGHNAEIDKFNSEGMLKADMSNQDAAMKAQMQRMAGYEKVYAMRQALEDAKNNSINAGITGSVNMFNNIINTMYQNDMLGWKLRHNHNAISPLEGDTRATGLTAQGGPIRRRYRGFNI